LHVESLTEALLNNILFVKMKEKCSVLCNVFTAANRFLSNVGFYGVFFYMGHMDLDKLVYY